MIHTLQLGQFGRGRTPAGAADINPTFSNVKALLHMNGTDGGTTFTDVIGHTFTRSAGCTTSTEQSVFGGSSAKFDLGTANAPVKSTDHADWDLAGGDFTIECRVRFATLPSNGGNYTLCAKSLDDGVGDEISFWWRLYNGAGTYYNRFGYSTDGTTLIDTIFEAWTPSVDTWYALRVVRDGTDFYFFVDGTKLGSTGAIAGTFYDGIAYLTIGAMGDNANISYRYGMNGYMDEFRLSKEAFSIANYTPATAEFPDS